MLAVFLQIILVLPVITPSPVPQDNNIRLESSPFSNFVDEDFAGFSIPSRELQEQHDSILDQVKQRRLRQNEAVEITRTPQVGDSSRFLKTEPEPLAEAAEAAFYRSKALQAQDSTITGIQKLLRVLYVKIHSFTKPRKDQKDIIPGVSYHKAMFWLAVAGIHLIVILCLLAIHYMYHHLASVCSEHADKDEEVERQILLEREARRKRRVKAARKVKVPKCHPSTGVRPFNITDDSLLLVRQGLHNSRAAALARAKPAHAEKLLVLGNIDEAMLY